MKISRSKLAAIITQRTQSSVTTKQLSQEIAAYLLTEGRTGELDSVMRDVMQLRADEGTVEVIATDARPLAANVRKDIESVVRELYPKAKQIIISENLDPTIIGGVQISLANQQLDLSVRAKLNRFKQLTAPAGGF